MLIRASSTRGYSLAQLEHQRRVGDWLYWWEASEWEKSAWVFRTSKAALIAVPTGFGPQDDLHIRSDGNAWVRWLAVADSASETFHLRRVLGLAENKLRAHGVQHLWVLTTPFSWPSRTLLTALGFSQAEKLITLRKLLFASSQLPTAWHVREITPDDIPALLDLDTQAFNPPWRLGSADLQRLLSRALLALLVEAEGKVAGYLCALDQSGGESAHIVRLAVSPAYRRQGIGTALLLEAERLLAQHGAQSVSLNTMESNQPARQLYSALGFKPMRTPAWVWRKPLIEQP
ncbi:MAG: GNAT family N-acetyltransferase [Thermoflexales bacterium]|nr:GNAT family N-acetyltransferase [Thermoflexales bacterium]MCS7324775.1 GNAT family N-acetyltransferase [Thermoflexales bacterium]MCX7939341.1 GNAT family N-acetyltransferase [Thermoflexales bacterium]MDW8053099.1 GNAT family N-acetyltransferase [Anaerolineae bacterium]MDW8291752.1 GNAT family N-acetyltransferase [Anaerolineae bacterium]